MKDLTLEEIDDLEAKYPPLVGCRTQVFLEPHERASASNKDSNSPMPVRDEKSMIGGETSEMRGEQMRANSRSNEEWAQVLKSLLTPVQTFLELCSEPRLNQEAINELRPMCLRNLETVRSYLSEVRGNQPTTR